MGIFDLFRKKQEPIKEAHQLSLAKSNEWIKNRRDKIIEDIRLEINSLIREFNTQKELLGENVLLLGMAEVKDERVLERAKHIMEGNSENYIQKLNQFINENEIPLEFEKIEFFCNKFDNSMDELTKTTVKSHNIMQEFFIKETNALSNSVKDLDKVVFSLKKILQNSKLGTLRKIEKSVFELESRLKEEKDLETKATLLKADISATEEKITEISNTLKTLKESKEYGDFLNTLVRRDNILQEMNRIKADLLRFFSAIEPALRKYENYVQDKLAKEYLDNHFRTLMDNGHLGIQKIISEIKSLIVLGRIELREEKKERILAEINRLEENYFAQLIIKYKELNKKLEEITAEIDNVKIDKKVRELASLSDAENLKAGEEKQRLDRITKQLEEINIDSLKSDLEKEIMEHFKEDIKIKL